MLKIASAQLGLLTILPYDGLSMGKLNSQGGRSNPAREAWVAPFTWTEGVCRAAWETGTAAGNAASIPVNFLPANFAPDGIIVPKQGGGRQKQHTSRRLGEVFTIQNPRMTGFPPLRRKLARKLLSLEP
jgi:hypothetical protein